MGIDAGELAIGVVYGLGGHIAGGFVKAKGENGRGSLRLRGGADGRRAEEDGHESDGL